MWKSGMLARCSHRTCMDMLSVGVCDRVSVHTLTVLAEKKESLPSIDLADRPVPQEEPSSLPRRSTPWDQAEICSRIPDASTRRLSHSQGKASELTLLRRDRVLIKPLQVCVECSPRLRLRPQVRVCHPKCSSCPSGPVWSRHLQRTAAQPQLVSGPAAAGVAVIL